MAELDCFNDFRVTAAAILENGGTLPVWRFLDSACIPWSVYQISSKLGDKWPNKSISMIFKMDASAS